MENLQYFRGHPFSNMYPCNDQSFYSSESVYQFKKTFKHGELSLAEEIKNTKNS